MRIGVLPDIHFGYGDTASVTAALERVIDRFNDDFHPEVVVVLGDLIHESKSDVADRELLTRVAGILDAVKAPVTYLLGNHDVINLDYERIQGVLDQDRYGVVGDTAHVYLDSSAPRLAGARGEVDPEQLSFLREELSGADARLVFVHHPIHYYDIRDNYWFGSEPERAFCGNKKEINSIIEEDDSIIATFNGHLHETHYTSDQGMHHFTINAFNRERPGGGVTGTFAEVELGEILRVRVVEGNRITRTVEVPAN